VGQNTVQPAAQSAADSNRLMPREAHEASRRSVMTSSVELSLLNGLFEAAGRADARTDRAKMSVRINSYYWQL
jgi:hypothetical protein